MATNVGLRPLRAWLPPRIALAALALFGFCTASAARPAVERISIHFEALSKRDGLTLSLTVAGDRDGVTTFSNQACCGIRDARTFVDAVQVRASGKAVSVSRTAEGWAVHHRPGEQLVVRYRLRPSGRLQIESGTAGQFRPIVHEHLFHLIGTTALLLPTGRREGDPVILDIDATAVVDDAGFVSSFGHGSRQQDLRCTRRQLVSALYLGGRIDPTLHETSAGTLGVVHADMAPHMDGAAFNADALAITAAARDFFGDSQPWYLVSMLGAGRQGTGIHLGGGTGLTNAFAMFAADDLDLGDTEQRAQMRWVLMHEYLHQWIGLTVRVAALPGSQADDPSVYWFSEGVTDFYTMRLLTRAGLQTPHLSLGVLDDRLKRYALSKRRDTSARDAGPLFWNDPDGGRIPYLRGYLAAWFVEIAAQRSGGGHPGLDVRLRELVKRARQEPGFRVDSAFLATYLSHGMRQDDARVLSRFILEGGAAPFAVDDFAPCLRGAFEHTPGPRVLQYEFTARDRVSCFRH